VTSLRGIVADLAAHGSGDILVPNLRDVSLTAEVRHRGAEAVADARRLSQRYNRSLERALADFAAGPGIGVVNGGAHQSGPGRCGLYQRHGALRPSAHVRGYLFRDNVHPTKDAHRRLAEAALVVISQTERPGAKALGRTACGLGQNPRSHRDRHYRVILEPLDDRRMARL
jgi:phospholipase/lecithinase/hemolysin